MSIDTCLLSGLSPEPLDPHSLRYDLLRRCLVRLAAIPAQDCSAAFCHPDPAIC
jgi:hypothetical protein